MSSIRFSYKRLNKYFIPMKRAFALQHIESEEMGHTEEWLHKHGYSVRRIRLYDGDTLPNAQDVDFLVVLGGPMSVNDTADYPWIAKEVAFLKEVLKRPVPVLGICLGAQLLAKALCANIIKSQEKEIGWYPIKAHQDAHTAIPGFELPESLTVLHWHGESFELPSDTTLLASSEGCRNQAFCLKPYQVGLQFHLEADDAAVRTMLEHSKKDMVDAGPFLQSEITLIKNTGMYAEKAKSVLFDLMNAMDAEAGKKAKAA